MKWFLEALKKYADGRGRARRKEYWMFVLFYMLFLILFAVIDVTADLIPDDFIRAGLPYGVFTIAYLWLIIVPFWAVSVRRLHDTGRSGWYLILALIPVIGGFWLFVLMLLEGTYGENRFGADPKTASTQWGIERSVANTFLVASVAMLIMAGVNIYTMVTLHNGFAVGFIQWFVTPLFLLLIGLFLRREGKDSRSAAWCMVLYGVFAFFLSILPSAQNIENFGLVNIRYTGGIASSFLSALGLLLIGVQTIQHKKSRTAIILLVTGAILSIVFVLFRNVGSVSFYEPYIFLIGNAGGLTNVAFILLGYSLWKKEEVMIAREIPAIQPNPASARPAVQRPQPQPAPQVSSGSAGRYPIFTGTGVCDVCNRPLIGVQAYAVPNHVFYNSPLYRAYFKRTFPGMTDAHLSMMQMKDQSAGSAVCEKCIYMF
ncbi:DUF805 domain-containing protein [Parabacteroides sp. PF5-9]|uniref:DUF805 domain-containing protein n=1 Tax=Parabacteroides sp. PF5-9 TaxID=1742404 RepID=UPI002476A730|nr:DUF805 domain-containing protein [Parabacteroides sp. PF5-9]MDH6357975.1 uncharacterized membrane protein YhaH (DUF805 family) [Parabacteroides sp. PF5-9]